MRNPIQTIRGRGLTASHLKLFAIVTMFIDHLTFTFLERTYDTASGIVTAYTTDALYLLDRIGRSIGRQAFPIFAFFIVEGFYHTRSRARYLARLSVFAVISQLPFYLMCNTGPVGAKRSVSINVYATLALGLLSIWIVDAVFMRFFRSGSVWSGTWVSSDPGPAGGAHTVGRRESSAGQGKPSAGRQAPSAGQGKPSAGRQAPSAGRRNFSAEWADRQVCAPELFVRVLFAAAAVAAICWFAYVVDTDYDYVGIIAIVLFYILRDNRRAAVMAVWVWMTCGSSLEIFAIAGLLLLLLYNGQQGGTSGSAVRKYAFYVFYPAHMLVLYALRILIAGY